MKTSKILKNSLFLACIFLAACSVQEKPLFIPAEHPVMEYGLASGENLNQSDPEQQKEAVQEENLDMETWMYQLEEWKPETESALREPVFPHQGFLCYM